MVVSKPGARIMSAPAAQASGASVREERPVLFQHYFKSGPRTYAAQVKQASNGRPFLVLTEGRREANSDEVHKSRIMVFNDDLTAFFHLLQETAIFLRPLRMGKTAVSESPAPATAAMATPAAAPAVRAAAPVTHMVKPATAPVTHMVKPEAHAAAPAPRVTQGARGAGAVARDATAPSRPAAQSVAASARPRPAAAKEAPSRGPSGSTKPTYRKSVAAQPAKPRR